ncbi:MAG: hypothetical protein WEE64_03335 [Dehalococcoidia bacterium]
MDTRTLVDHDIIYGNDLVKALDASRFEVDAAYWYYLSDPDRWRLIIASPIVDREGPRKAYDRILTVLEGMPSPKIAFDQVSVVSPRDHVVRSLSRAAKTGPETAGMRISRSTIDGVFVEDAYIYRPKRGRALSRT